MRVRQDIWPVSKLLEDQEKINLNPSWQRGPAWKEARQVLLIDSILRGLDIPKIYLRKLPISRAYSYEAVDGQQRLRAIWQFRDDKIALSHPDSLKPIDGKEIHGRKFSQLESSLQKRFESFAVNVAEIEHATNDEITNLFSRLQMGISLNPAELRNAMAGPLRHYIDVIGAGHRFFCESRISSARYKRQDYAAHLFAMAIYQGERDIKAPSLKSMVSEYASAKPGEVLGIAKMVESALNVLSDVNASIGHYLTQKWLVVDLGWLIMQWQAEGKDISTKNLVDGFVVFENMRKDNLSEPESLLVNTKGRSKAATLNKHLYNYIGAFKAQGGMKTNLCVRNAALRAFLE
jgi:hypothetical protein